MAARRKTRVTHKILREWLEELDPFSGEDTEGKVGPPTTGDKMEEQEQGISDTDLKTLTAVVDDYDEDEAGSVRKVEDDTDYDEKDLATLKFAEDIKILLIGTVEFRIICHFLGSNSVKDIQTALYKHVTMIGQMNQQCLIQYMKSKDFAFAGEIFFDNQGNPVPVSKQTWNIHGKDIIFTNTGYMFFEAKSGKKKDNLVAMCWTDGQNGLAGVTLYAMSSPKAKKHLSDLEDFTKKHNCIRGAKLRDVNMSAATFSEVNSTKKHTWENFYFPKAIREMYKLEVFGFLNATERYNALGISKRGVLMYGPPGTGKCLALGTTVLMFDGSIKKVEDVLPGDRLIGPDSKPRFVKNIARGREKMYKITPSRGDSYTVNESHILSVRMCRDAATFKKGEIVNIPVKNYLSHNDHFRHYAMGWRSSVDFSSKSVVIDPYLLGIWLGDGSSDDFAISTTDKVVLDHFRSVASNYGLSLKNKTKDESKCPTWRATTGVLGGDISTRPQNALLDALREYDLIGNKHVPLEYKANDRQIRLELLAGLIDSDGYVAGSGFGMTLKNESLLDDVVYLCRSLGLAAYKTQCQNTCTNSLTRARGTYWRCHISGDTSIVPTKIKRPDCRISSKNVLNVGIKVEDVGEGDYYGFEIGGDGLFLLGDFTVTHNTTIGHILCNEAPDSTVIWITPDLISENNNGKYSIKLLYMLADFVSPSVIFLEDLDLFGEDRDSTQGDIPLGALMNILDGVNQVKNAVTIATTNRLELIEKALSNRPGRFDRVVEIPAMPAPLRKKMFADRLEECKVDVGAVDEIVKISDGWTGAQCQEFINSINLLFISRNTDKERHVTKEVINTVNEMIQSLSNPSARKRSAGFTD
jgi:AAA+ superfamily predicted ATPase